MYFDILSFSEEDLQEKSKENFRLVAPLANNPYFNLLMKTVNLKKALLFSPDRQLG